MYHIFKSLCAVFVGVTSIFGASTIAVEVVDAPAPTTTQPSIQQAEPIPAVEKPVEFTTPNIVLPDFSGIDFSSMHEAIAEQRRIVQQAKTDEARFLYGKCGEWRDDAIMIGWPEEEWPVLSEIMWRESKCDPLAWSGSDAGLLQINRIHTEWASMMGWSWPNDLFVAENNLLFSLRLWQESGWKPWRFSGPIPD